MPRINQLPPSVVTKIAAGEVIERPASVVKELLENSIDAGSKRIEIEVAAGGSDLIQIVDDGCGIYSDDLPLAFSSHATSKLRDADDLFKVGTLGFRGEALASIGGVAQVTLQSQTRDQANGGQLTCYGGELSAVKAWNGAPGTRICVKHLFFNTPVRRKFLRTTPTEMGHISEAVTRIALAKPDIHITLKHNGKKVYELPPVSDLRDRIGLFFGEEVQCNLYAIEADHGLVKLHGFIADPVVEKGNSKQQYLFLNDRWIRDRSVLHALQEAYRGLLMTGRYAVAFLFLTVPPDQVDVNVHPTKSEVRFRDNSLIYSLTLSTIRRRLSAENLTAKLQVSSTMQPPAVPTPSPTPIGTTSSDTDSAPTPPPKTFPEPPSHYNKPVDVPTTPNTDSWPIDSPSPSADQPISVPPSTTPDRTAEQPAMPSSAEELASAFHQAAQASTPPPPPSTIPHSHQANLNAIQLYNAYLVLETPEGMLVIDQHALHERILFEQLKTRFREGGLETQSLLIPETIELTPEQVALTLEHKEALADLGFAVEDFGGGTLLLHSYPAVFNHRSPERVLRAVVEYLISKDRAPTRDLMLNDVLSLMACHSAVRAGDPLTPDQIANLIAQRKLADDHHHCPHGRPTALLFTKHDLDKQFGRV